MNINNLTVTGLKAIAQQEGIDTRGLVREDIVKLITDHYAHHGWPEHLSASSGGSEVVDGFMGEQGQDDRASGNLVGAERGSGVPSGDAGVSPTGSVAPGLNAAQMQAIVQAVLQALEIRDSARNVAVQQNMRTEHGGEREGVSRFQMRNEKEYSEYSERSSLADNWNQIKFASKYIPPFCGKEEENVVQWLERVAHVARVHRVTDEVLLLAVIGQLKDRACDWHNRQPLGTIDTWEEFKYQIRNYFERKESYAMTHARISRRIWKSNVERFRDYAEDKLQLMQLLKLTEQEQIELLADGVKDPQFRRMVLNTWAKTVPEFIQHVRRITDDETQIRKTEFKTKIAPKGQPPAPSHKSCYICKRPGHWGKDCRTKVTCYRCGQQGHVSSTCQVKTASQPTTLHVREDDEEQTTVNERAEQEEVSSINTHQYVCNLFAENKEKICVNLRAVNNLSTYSIWALLDTGSPVNLIRHSVFKAIFKDTPLLEIRNIVILRGVNGSKIKTYGKSFTQIHLEKFQNAVFDILWFVVADDTMIYDAIIGREFIDNSKLKLTYCEGQADLEYNNRNTSVMCVESILPIHAIEEKDKYDVVVENLGNKLPWNCRQDLLNLLKEIDEMEIEPEKDEYFVRVNIKDSSLFRYAPRRMSFDEKKQLDEITDDLLKREIIKPSISPYCSRVVLVNKRSGQKRMCVDLRPLNQRVYPQKYPFPVIEDHIDQLYGKHIFTKLDLKDGFHQIKIHPDDTKYFAFSTHKAQYEFIRLPFGYSEAPAEFQKRILFALGTLIQQNKILVYIDDLLIATTTIEENLSILRETLILLKKYNLELNLSKCSFFKPEIEYLGYVISSQGVTMSQRHIEAIVNFPEPKNVKEVQGFLGLTNYFRKFLKDYALKAKPLQNLIKKDVEFIFSEECKRSLKILKNELSSPPLLKIYNPSAETELHTDASSLGFGAILFQKQTNGNLSPIAYFSRATSETERRYHSYELETLAIVKAVERFHVYLQGINFKIVTDCNSLVLAFKKININPRIARWSLLLQNYHFEIVHRSGDKMRHVDCLSRNVATINAMSAEDELLYKQLTDPRIKEIAESVELKGSNDFTLMDGLVFRLYKNQPLFVVPDSMVQNIIRIYHDDMGHVGPDKTAQGILSHYWFPGMKIKIRQHIDNCIKCLTYSTPSGKPEGEMHIVEKNTSPFHSIHLDHFGPLTATEDNYKHILVVIDVYTRFVWLFPVRSTGTEEVLLSLRLLFAMFGNPQKIITDRGTAFSSNSFADFIKEIEAKHSMTAVASPWANGQVERVNRFLKSTLAKIDSQNNDWKINLPKVQYVINNSFNKSIDTSPSKMLLGYEQRHKTDDCLRSLVDKLRNVTENCTEEREKARDRAVIVNKTLQEYNKEHYDRRHKKCTLYKPGDLVMVKITQYKPGVNQKLEPKFKGPYQIKAALNNNRYVVTDIPGYNLTQKPLNTILSPDKLKPWIRVTENDTNNCEQKLEQLPEKTEKL